MNEQQDQRSSSEDRSSVSSNPAPEQEKKVLANGTKGVKSELPGGPMMHESRRKAMKEASSRSGSGTPKPKTESYKRSRSPRRRRGYSPRKRERSPRSRRPSPR